MKSAAAVALLEPEPSSPDKDPTPDPLADLQRLPVPARDGWLKLILAAGLAALLALWAWDRLRSLAAQDFARLYLDNPSTLILLLFSLALGVGVTIWRVGLVKAHRPAPELGDDRAPMISVIVPAYNEGRLVMDTLLSVAASDYPAHKMQILAVDDGSTDDTYAWMEEASRRLGARLELIKQPSNGGKRLALYAGFQRSRGEVLVTIDSDSLVAPTTLRRLVAPLAADPRVGAVAGNVRVLNAHEGILAKILDVCFTYSFDFIRVAESQVETVACTPGALSAYRRRAVWPLLNKWLEQRFLGVVAKIGEDRALTNLVLGQGYITRLAPEAVVFTKVPVSYRPMCRMLLRWARSNIRETLVMSRFIFTGFRAGGAKGARFNLLLSVYGMTVGEVLKVMGLYYLFMDPLNVGLKMLIGCAVASLVPMAIYAIRHRSSDCLYALPFVLLWVFGVSWISLYALCTPRRSAWLTRGLNGADTRVAAPALTALRPLPVPVSNRGVSAFTGRALPR